MNVCSYHLQEAGATPEQELSFALATATAVLDELRPRVDPADFPALVGPHLFLCERRHPVCDRDVQNARFRRSMG